MVGMMLFFCLVLGRKSLGRTLTIHSLMGKEDRHSSLLINKGTNSKIIMTERSNRDAESMLKKRYEVTSNDFKGIKKTKDVRVKSAVLCKRRKRGLEECGEMVTVPGRTPIVVVLPYTTFSPEEMDRLLGYEKKCQMDRTTEDALGALDSQWAINCCPAGFEPVAPDDCYGLKDPQETTKRRPAYIYSCKWHCNREPETELFLQKVHPQSINIQLNLPDDHDNRIPCELSLEH